MRSVLPPHPLAEAVAARRVQSVVELARGAECAGPVQVVRPRGHQSGVMLQIIEGFFFLHGLPVLLMYI